LRNRHNPTARARVTDKSHESHQKLCQNAGPTLSGTSKLWLPNSCLRVTASGEPGGEPIAAHERLMSKTRSGW
jgi:hypothetical protein